MNGRTTSTVSIFVFTLALAGFVLSGCSATSLQKELNWHRQQRQILLEEKHEIERQLNVSAGEQESLKKTIVELTGELQGYREMERRPIVVPAVGSVESDVSTANVSVESVPVKTGFEGIEGVLTERTNREIRLILGQAMFPSGTVSLTKKGAAMLDGIAAVLKRGYADYSMRIEGHTDNAPVTKVKARYPSNWELSSARAAAVLRALTARGAVDAERCHISGYGATRPIASNETEEGRRVNRRVEIVLRAP